MEVDGPERRGPPDGRTGSLEVRAPPVSGKVESVRHLEGGRAGELPSLTPVCPPLSSPSTLSCSTAAFAPVLGLCFSGCHPIHLCWPPGPPPSISGADLFLLLGVSVSLHFPVLAFCSLFLSLRLTLGHFYVYLWSLAPLSVSHVLSIIPAGLCLSSLMLASAPPSLHPSLFWVLPLSHFLLILAPLPVPLSSSVPSSPLSPSPSAVSPTGSACCSPCSCTAAWGPWPGATSPR